MRHLRALALGGTAVLAACGSPAVPRASGSPSRSPSAVVTRSPAATRDGPGCRELAATLKPVSRAAKSSPYGIVKAGAVVNVLGSSAFQQSLYAAATVRGIAPSLKAAVLALGTDGTHLYTDTYSGKTPSIRADEAAVRADLAAMARDCP